MCIRDRVQAIYPKYDKTVQSKCENGDAYGVSLRPDAMAALYAHFAPELAEGRKAVKKDAHRLTCRISARLETADYEALQRLIEAEGYATTQDWLTATVRRYIDVYKRQSFSWSSKSPIPLALS